MLWSSWSSCAKTCGGGARERRRSCTNPPPFHGGQGCGTQYYESKECAFAYGASCMATFIWEHLCGLFWSLVWFLTREELRELVFIKTGPIYPNDLSENNNATRIHGVPSESGFWIVTPCSDKRTETVNMFKYFFLCHKYFQESKVSEHNCITNMVVSAM